MGKRENVAGETCWRWSEKLLNRSDNASGIRAAMVVVCWGNLGWGPWKERGREIFLF